MITLTAHQPNFFPYYPVFQKMEQADVFVILENVQYEKGGYQNRFQLDGWRTMRTHSGLLPIVEKRYVSPFADWVTTKTSLPKYQELMGEFDDCVTHYLSKTNSCIITKAAQKLGIKTKITYDYKTNLKGTARLVDLCQKHGATKYLSGISGKKYLDLLQFKRAGIEVEFQDESTMIKKPLLEVLYERA